MQTTKVFCHRYQYPYIKSVHNQGCGQSGIRRTFNKEEYLVQDMSALLQRYYLLDDMPNKIQPREHSMGGG